MRIRIIAVGTKMPAWVREGWNDYLKRLPPELNTELVEIAPGPRGKGLDVNRAIAREGAAMTRAVGTGDRIVALEVGGRPWSTEHLAEQLRCWQLDGDNYSLLIGGPDGLAPECLATADMKWSLSPLTLPHPLVRVVLIEQLYRAWSLNAGHPYHRG